ncbi:metallophosphoesterase [Myxococcota bacterium]
MARVFTTSSGAGFKTGASILRCWLCLLCLAGCTKGRQPGAWLSEATHELPDGGSGRIVAIGDLHGDLSATKNVLALAGAIDEESRWIGGDLVVVQTGDQLDRGDEDRVVVDLFRDLEEQASSEGGRVLSLVGNHETMNVDGRMDYVTPGGYQAFWGIAGLDLEAPWLAVYPGDQRPRRAAFHPGGPYARLLAERPVVVKIGDTIFVHGGISASDVDYGLDRINREVRDWMLDQGLPPVATTASTGPLWSTQYSHSPTAEICATLSDVLARLAARRMVVAHVVQSEGINSACDGKVWRIDVGLSSFYGGPVQVLEIVGAEARVLETDPPQP